jgi:hypothetical protein
VSVISQGEQVILDFLAAQKAKQPSRDEQQIDAAINGGKIEFSDPEPDAALSDEAAREVAYWSDIIQKKLP